MSDDLQRTAAPRFPVAAMTQVSPIVLEPPARPSRVPQPPPVEAPPEVELTIDGVETSRGFHLRVLDHPDFQSGDISIQWLEEKLPELTKPNADADAIRLAAIAAALVAHEERTAGRASLPAPAAANGSGAGDGTASPAPSGT